jgi:transcriptional regulator of nitric oxide reductase/ferredoxin
MLRALKMAFAALICIWGLGGAAIAQVLTEQDLATKVEPPYELGEKLSDRGVWSIRDRTGIDAGYIFETGPLAPLPGFSGAAIHVLVTLDGDGRFLRAELLEHNEPIFVSGLGQAPFHEFMRQYRGLSVFDQITVGVPYGAGDRAASSAVYLDGVTKATASVRIAHESILAASLEVARRHMQGLAGGPAPRPLQDGDPIAWERLVDDGIAQRRLILNRDVEAAFAGTLWEDDDPEASEDPDGIYLDLWVIDIGPRAVAAGVLDAETLAERDQFMSIATEDEPLLLLANGRHRLVSDQFVRNTAPDLMSAEQDGLPIALRDADIEVGLAPNVPEFEHRMILRTDRRLGFDPTREWDLNVRAVRLHGMFRPETGTHDFTSTHSAPERFFVRPEPPVNRPVWVETALARSLDLGVLALFLTALVAVLARAMRRISVAPGFQTARLAVLTFVAVFIGWWGQGQLSIVTVTGVLRTGLDGASFEFLLYDPFSLVIWGVVLASLIVWGRGLFCGWLCPYGALQEIAHAVGRALHLPEVRVPDAWDRRLKWVKYGVLAVLIAAAIWAPAWNDTLAEVEPFKTAITTGFDREWFYVLYAALWIALGLIVFKAFCRYVCPLGAALALGGLMRRRDWIPRRAECGSPCQLCKVRCNYNAITRDGRIQYDECFQCLDCVTIHEDRGQCVPLILADRKGMQI